MAIILSKIFAGIMSVVVMLSGWFPALFGGKEYIDPYSSDVLVSSEICFTDIKKPMVITDHETALKHFGFEENGVVDDVLIISARELIAAHLTGVKSKIQTVLGAWH